MWRKIVKIIFLAFAAWVAVEIQVSWISAWPPIFNQISPVLILVIFGIFFSDLETAIILDIFLGFWLDMSSFYFFGAYSLTILLSVLLAYWVLKNWLTNRSLYSLLALFFLVTIFYDIFSSALFYASASGSSGFFLFYRNFWFNLIGQIGWGFLISLLSFHSLIFLTKKMRPAFLEKKNYL